MNRVIIIFSFISVCTFVNAQNTAFIESAFSAGNASKLASEMAKEIELCVGNDVQFLSAREAVQSLNNWFSKVKPESINGKMVGGSSVKYYSGQVATSKGNYRLFVYYNNKNGTYKIDEIRIGSK